MPEITNSKPQDAVSAPHAANLRLVAGYDGSPPATRALGAATAMLQGRHGSIEVVYVARVPSVDMMSADALVGVEADFDQIEKELRASAAAQLDGRGIGWDFQRRQGLVAAELIAAASAVVAAHPGDTVVIAVGSSSHARHRVLGSVAVGLARHCPVPVVIVP